MKLYTSLGTHPRIVKLYLAEKGVAISEHEIDIGKGEHLAPAYLAKNPLGQMPTLELDNGVCISQVTAICEYLEERHPSWPLIGASAEQRAETRMWLRRIDLMIAEPIIAGFRYSEGLMFYQDRMRVIPQAADDFKALARENIVWLDRQTAGRAFVCGARFTLADIFLFCFLDFADKNGQQLDRADLKNIPAWFDRMNQRFEALQSNKI